MTIKIAVINIILHSDSNHYRSKKKLASITRQKCSKSKIEATKANENKEK